MKNAQLDIDETTLVFKYPELYYLDLNLKYKVDFENGNAKFDKTKKTLTIKLPVIGSTDVSQKVLDERFKDYLEKEKEKKEMMKKLEMSKLEEEMEKRQLRKPGQEDQENQENAGDSNNQDNQEVQVDEAVEGVSKTKFIQAVDGQTTSDDIIDDKYGHIGGSIAEVKEDESKGQDKRDKATIRREEFLNIYKEENDSNETGADAGLDLANGIKIRHDEPESQFDLKTSPDSGNPRPLIQELDSAETA